MPRRGKSEEATIQEAILEYCQRPWLKLWRTNAGSRSYKMRGLPTGWPDITGYYSRRVLGEDGFTRIGIIVFIEVKKPGKVPTDDQMDFLQAAQEAGCIAGVARSVEDAMGILGLK